MKSKKQTIKETPQQKAMAEVASAQLADYKARWLPVQKALAQNIQQAGAAGSAERKAAAGRASTDSAVQFGQAKEQVEAKVAQTSGGIGSSKSKMAMAGLGDDEATSRGLGFVAADQAIDQAYLEGLGQLAAIGKGERGGAMRGMASIAASSGRQAQADAEIAATRRAGNAQLIGQVAGMGMSAAASGAFGNSGSWGAPDMPGDQPTSLPTWGMR